MLLLAAAWSEDWLKPSKLVFDGINKIIRVNAGVTTLDIREDVYSDWAEWVSIRDHIKFLPALRYTGLDPIGPGVFTGDSYFLVNGWKLSINLQKVKVTGILYSDDYETPYYTEDLAAQYAVTVSSLVNTVSVGGGSGSGPSAIQIRQEIDANSSKLINLSSSVSALPSSSQIAAQVRTNLTTELTHISTLSNSAGLTQNQATMLLELYTLFGLDPTKPLVVTENSRTAGDINQNMFTSDSETIVTRV